MIFSTWPDLLVVDVEGNGTAPPDLVEVAALPIRDGHPDKGTAKAWLTRPNRPVTSHATRVHGLSNDDLANKPTWDEIAGQVHDFMGTSWMRAHNAHTDYRVLSAHLPNWEPTGVLDTLRLARTTFPHLSVYSLDALIKHVRPDLREAPGLGRHRATFDAFATAQILIAMASRYETWEQLVVAAVPPGLPGAPEQKGEPTLW